MSPAPVERVSYYDPFTHYAAADVCRALVVLWAVAVAASVLILAWQRWGEDRRSASLFLVALTLASAAFGYAGVVALGRPPVWWYLALEFAVLVLTSAACLIAYKEANRGVWARSA
jgi:hypothetical protein